MIRLLLILYKQVVDLQFTKYCAIERERERERERGKESEKEKIDR